MVFRRQLRRFNRRRRAIRRTTRRFQRSRRVFRRKRVAKEGNVVCKFNSTQQITLSITGVTAFQIDPSLSSFAEAAPFIPIYENYRIRRIICRLRPNFNIGWPNPGTGAGSTSLQPYVIAAYHKAIASPSTLTVANALSLDKHKYVSAYRGTRMAFTPAVQTDITVEASTTNQNYVWRPQLSTANTDVPQYCGIIVWPEPTDTSAANASYTLELQAHVEFKNQRLNIA